MNKQVAALILNRNLGSVCDNLKESLVNHKLDEIYVVDCSTNSDLRSKNATLIVEDDATKLHGLRISRGFNLGIQHVLAQSQCEWIFCLPVDTEIVRLELGNMLKALKIFSKVVAVCPLEVDHPYTGMMTESDLAIAWNIPEGPILLRRDFLLNFLIDDSIQLFDSNNFRGYLSFVELAIKVYGNDFALAVSTDLVIREREDYLLSLSELIQTEPYTENRNLWITEGMSWLLQKYGFRDRWSLENIARILHKDFLERNPNYKSSGIY